MKTRREWDWSVGCMREVAEYALRTYKKPQVEQQEPVALAGRGPAAHDGINAFKHLHLP